MTDSLLPPRAFSRRRFLLGTAALGGLTVLAACSQASQPSPAAGTQPTTSAPPAAQGTTTAPAVAGGGVTVTFWNGLTGADGVVMDGLLQQFGQETGIKIEQQRVQWADLYAKLQVAVPAGEGPDLQLMHPTEIPHFARDGIIEPLDDNLVAQKGFNGEDYIESIWNAGMYQNKRYGLPLDVPQYLMFINKTLFKNAGLVEADGTPKAPKTYDDVLSMAKKMTQGDTYGFYWGAQSGTSGFAWGFFNALWQNGANVFKDDLKTSALTEPKAIQAADMFGSFFNRDKVSPPLGGNPRDAYVGGKLAMWIGGSWNFTGLKDVGFESSFAPTPQILQKPIAWIGPHQFTFPKSKTRDAAKTDAIWTWLRWITEHTPDWTLGAGQLPATKRMEQDPKLANLPIVKALTAQVPNWQLGQPSTKWPKAETLCLPIMESVYLGQRSAQDAMNDLAKQLNAINA